VVEIKEGFCTSKKQTFVGGKKVSATNIMHVLQELDTSPCCREMNVMSQPNLKANSNPLNTCVSGSKFTHGST
jgi:hypothetical protein